MQGGCFFSKVPGWIRKLAETVVGENALDLQEEAWNLFPYCRTGEKGAHFDRSLAYGEKVVRDIVFLHSCEKNCANFEIFL